MRVLLADDERTIAVTLGDALRRAGHEVRVVGNGEDALDALKCDPFDVVVSDIRMPKLDGLTLLEHVRQNYADTAVLLMTAYATVEDAVRAMRLGAHDYIQKPFLNDDVVARLERIEELLRLRRENVRLRREIEGRSGLGQLVGRSPKMRVVYDLIESIADSEATVLIEGESGTGKERAAEAVHFSSPRKGGPLVKMSCGAFPETLVEDELFGHIRGAFTDAKADKEGRFEKANGGTIFIDDIDDLKPSTQMKLLRVLQEREIERIGEANPRKVDVRVLAATKRPLWGLVQRGEFREDLYFRMNVVRVPLPPLRERPEDIPMLVAHFVKKFGKGREYEVPPETLEALMGYGWPGNVRELENAVERAIALAGKSNVLRREHLLAPVSMLGTSVTPTGKLAELKDVVAEAEARHIRAVLDRVGWVRSQAAEILGVTVKTLWSKMKQFGIEEAG